MSDPPTLVVEDVKVADMAIYTCRVDYKIRASAITKVNLTVIVPAAPPIILNESGLTMDSTVGPLKEGDQAHLTCRSAGGSPTPTLTWWKNGERLHQFGGVTTAGAESRITVEAKRGLHGATLTCQALNNNITEPSTKSVTVKVLLRPLSVEIVGSLGPLSSGRSVELVCRATGSTPPAQITWWKAKHQIKDVKYTVMNGGNVTVGSIHLMPLRSDDGLTIRCQAHNPDIPQSTMEDSRELIVHYKPEVSLDLGRPIDPELIKEGDDVYFECSVSANPPVHLVKWYLDGTLLEANKSAGLIISGQSLVLQKVGRERAGQYTCSAHNQEGQGLSNGVNLNVMYSPVCISPGRRTQGVAKLESASVSCEVEAFPPNVNFTWRFNGSAEADTLPPHTINSLGTFSMLNYTARQEQDYGTLLCWATNKIGQQREPCIIHLIPAGPPEAPRNCSIANQTSEALVVECIPGFNGGLQQTFLMEAWEADTLLTNTTNGSPEFVVRGLEAGMGVVLKMRAINLRGSSSEITLQADILKVAEKRMGPRERVLVPPVVGAIVGGVVTVLILIVVGLVITHYAHRSRPSAAAARNSTTPSPKTSITPPPPPMTNVFIGGCHTGDDRDTMQTITNPDVIRGASSKDDLVGGVTTPPRRVEAVAVLQSTGSHGVTTTLPEHHKLMSCEFILISKTHLPCSIRDIWQKLIFALPPHPKHPPPPPDPICPPPTSFAHPILKQFCTDPGDYRYAEWNGLWPSNQVLGNLVWASAVFKGKSPIPSSSIGRLVPNGDLENLRHASEKFH
ncbi:unnamed protein product, partial [Meganyctiphanes norvegica]